jgi:TolB-like protein
MLPKRRSMILSISYSIRAGFILFAVLIGLSVAAGPNYAEEGTDGTNSGQKRLKIAVFPVFNLSASPAPLKHIRRLLSGALQANGETIIDEQILENVFAKNRIRYVGGLDRSAASAVRQEAGADVVLITSLEHYSDVLPPKIALTARLVSTADRIRILWMDGVGLAGDDSPGLLDLGLIDNSDTLLAIAVQRILASLFEFLSTGQNQADSSAPRSKHRPKVIFRSPVLDPAVPHTVAVMPFFNLSERNFAGEIMALHFVRQLRARENFNVIEPGVVRQALLRGRVIMGGGISLADAGLISNLLEADLILSGKIMDYQDFQGLAANPKVDFSAEIFEEKSREVVWTVQSYNRGDDGVYFFDWRRVNTAYVMATQMVQLAVEDMVEPE